MKSFTKLLAFLMLVFTGIACSNCFSTSQVEPARYDSSQVHVRHMMNSVVAIMVIDPLSGDPHIGCTGFFVSPTQIATAHHCIVGHRIAITISATGEPSLGLEDLPASVGQEVEYVTYRDWTEWSNQTVHTSASLTRHLGVVTRFDEEHDVAIMRAPEESENWLTMSTGLPRIGERVYSVSQPGSLRWMLSEGIVAQLEDIEGHTFIMATAPVYFGSSGGPLINNQGLVVGVTNSIAYRQPNFGLFVPIVRVLSLFPTPTQHTRH